MPDAEKGAGVVIEKELGRRDLSCQCCSAVDDIGLNALIAEVIRLRAEQERISRLVCICRGARQHHWGCPTIRLGLARVLPPVEHRLVGTGCTCGKWKARLGESITRGFDLHLLDRRCASCGEPIPTTKRVDAETCSDRCAKDRQRARVTPPAGGREQEAGR